MKKFLVLIGIAPFIAACSTGTFLDDVGQGASDAASWTGDQVSSGYHYVVGGEEDEAAVAE